jgi:hypothetical protein
VNDLNRVIIDESRGNVHYKVCRKESGKSFTDYAIYRISSRAPLTPFFSNLSDDSFEDIYELGKYYFLRSEKCFSGFAFMDSRKLKEFPVPDTFEETGTFLNPVAAMTYALNRLSEEDRIRLNANGFISNGEKSELTGFLNNWLEKGHIKAHPRNNEKVIFKFVHPFLGNLSKESGKNRMIVNANFFVLEKMDMSSPYSMVGQPFGALIGNGKVMLPPLFRRETLLRHKDGRIEVRAIDISDVQVVIGNDTYKDGVNARFFRRPDFERTPACNGTDLIIVNHEMLAFKHGGNSEIPDAGFVVQIHSNKVPCDRSVQYFFDDSVDFAVQAGPSLIIDGKSAKTIRGEFHALKKENQTGVSFPPNVFETEWNVSKAARMAIGFTQNELVFLWVTGCNTGEYIEGYDSLGFTFNEMAEQMLAEGVRNAVSLDGGGSSQLLNGKAKVLKLADRRGLRGHEFERPTPVGIKITF